MINFLRTYRYELIAALVGATVMMVEIVGARLIAPYFGTSVFVWTAMIGVILGALSVGYWYGGKLADVRADDKGLATLITFAAGLLLLGILMQELVLSLLAATPLDLRISALVAAVTLFAPASLFMGAVSPYLVKLKLSSMKTAGRSVGRMYAAGTLGSIFGTFAAGYFLIGMFGSLLFSYLLILGLLAVSFAASRRATVRLRLGLATLTIVFMSLFASSPGDYKVIYDTDSSYARYQVLEETEGGRTMRVLKMDHSGVQSGVYTDAPSEMAFAYTKRFMEAVEAGQPKSVLMIGGGAFTVPRALVETNPDVQVDVVEIDPKLTDLAKQFFFYEDHPRIEIINQDGRTYINNSTKNYDLIFVDAFNSLTPPFQLTTVEATEMMAGQLNPSGVVAVNLIGAVTGKGNRFFTSEYLTYQQVFDSVKVKQASAKSPLKQAQNLLMVAGNDESQVDRVLGGVNAPLLATPDTARALVLTDDYAPVEQMLYE